MTDKQLEKLLVRFGFLQSGDDVGARKLKNAVKNYQRFHGLASDGVVGPVTTRSLHAHRFCGLPDEMSMGRQICKWPAGHTMSWAIYQDLPGVSRDQFLSVCQKGWDSWAQISGFRHVYKSNARTANCLIGIQTLSPGGVLADSGLPCGAGAQTQIRQRYDSAEPWDVTADASQTQRHKISLLTVAEHEMGHAIGIGHIPMNSGRALMNPTYSPQTPHQTILDIEEAQRRYPGQPAGPAPQPNPTPGGDLVLHHDTRVWISGVIYQSKGPMEKV